MKEEVAECSESDSDSVVFTTMDGDSVDVIKSHRETSKGTPIEMPFMEEGGSTFPKAVSSGSFIHAAPTSGRVYAPSSPKSRCVDKKRGYEPSSPKTRATRARVSD
jgi:hypothetical protein